MMRIIRAVVVLGMLLSQGLTTYGEVHRPLKVLAIGNSYSVCVTRQMPQVAADLGLKLDLLSANIGGCSLEKHVRLMDNPKVDPHRRPWYCNYSYADGGKPNLPNNVWNFLRDAILADTWDVISIQQVSSSSWNPETFHPWGDELVSRIRTLAPQAEIVVQETWADPKGSGRLVKWKLSTEEMYARLHAAYAAFAASYGFRVIPTGTAVERARPLGMLQKKIQDPHLNPTGEFLQALVWTEKLFGVDVRKGTYVPEGIAAELAKNLRAVAHQVVSGNTCGGEVKFSGETLLVDGKPFVIRGGEIHPQRVPREYWQHRIRMMKAMGLNTVSSYFFWNDFERTDGSFDFTSGNRDVAAFLQLCHQEKMKVLFRPGPYCCGEWDYGGLPSRMLAKKGYLIRTTKNPDYLKECTKYLTAICEVARPYLWQNGGPIVLTQIENEYGSWRAPDRTPDLIVWTKDLLKRLGFGPFYMADGVGDYFYRNLPYPDPEIAVGMDPGMNEKDWDVARKINPGVPVFSSETYPGWLRHWGEGNWRPSDLSKEVAWYVKEKKAFCFFVVHGGTSFGFSAGANDGEGKGGFEPDMTSYDYGSPISEQGLATPDYYRYRNILAEEVGGVDNLPKVPAPIPTMTIPEFTPEFLAPLTANCGKAFESESCVHFESFGQNQGMAIYETALPENQGGELVFERIADYAKIMVDGRLVATLDRRLGQRSCKVPECPKGTRLTIIVEAMGHVNFDVGMQDDRKGISGKVALGGIELKGWIITPKPLLPETVLGAQCRAAVPGLPGGHYRGTFNLSRTADTFMDMSKWTKGTVFVNGHNLGRYWKIGPQYSLYCPASWLKVGSNQIDVIEMDLNSPKPIRGADANVVIETGKNTKNANNVW